MSTYSYDETVYTSTSFPQTHPIKAATIATLFGMTPTPAERCHVLELGCADGANLIPLAQSYPNSTFVGIDLSIRQVESGVKAIQDIGLTNITLQHKNILEFDAKGMKFDYIIVHGVFSWVPAEVRERILALCQESLTKNGIAYISYNTLPGWHMRGMLRDMMIYHTAQFTDEKQKIDQGRAILKFLSDSVPTDNNPYGLFLRGELNSMGKWSDSYLRHEFLEDDNQAFYFHEFNSAAVKHGLQYLGEPELSSILATNFAPEVHKTLYQIGRNIIGMEQYMDFLRNRTFRMTLLVRSDHVLNRSLMPTIMKDFWFSTTAQAVNGKINITSGIKEDFRVGKTSISTESALVKAILVALQETAPNQMNFAELSVAVRHHLRIDSNAIREKAAVDHEDIVLCDQLLLLYSRGMVEAVIQPFPRVATQYSGKLNTTPLIRHQAMNHTRHVTNLRHVSIQVDGFARQVISLVDGTRTQQDLVSAMADKVRANAFAVHNDGKPVTDQAQLEQILAPRVEAVLDQMSKVAFLSAE